MASYEPLGWAGGIDFEDYVRGHGNLMVRLACAVYATGVFGASRVADAVPVTVNGTPGLFGEVSVWPVNGQPEPVSGKQDVPKPSLVWQVGRHWIVLQINHPGAAQLQQAAARLAISTAD